MLVLALLCLLPVALGVRLAFDEEWQALGFALVGFFGAGVVVLARRGLTGS